MKSVTWLVVVGQPMIEVMTIKAKRGTWWEDFVKVK